MPIDPSEFDKPGPAIARKPQASVSQNPKIIHYPPTRAGIHINWKMVVGIVVVVWVLVVVGKYGKKESQYAVVPPTPEPPVAPASTPPTYTQPTDTNFFQNTLPDTDNMGQDQSQAQDQASATPATKKKATSLSQTLTEQSAVVTHIPVDPPAVRCILPTGADILISRTECRGRSGVIFDGE